MNRYTAAGVLADMRNGRRVLVLSQTQPLARLAFAEVSTGAQPSERVRRANGDERITAAGGPGWIAFGSSGGNRFRGVTADVVVLDAHAPGNLDSILPVVAASPTGEVIRP